MHGHEFEYVNFTEPPVAHIFGRKFYFIAPERGPATPPFHADTDKRLITTRIATNTVETLYLGAGSRPHSSLGMSFALNSLA